MASEDALTLLRSIDGTLKELLALTKQRTTQMRAAAPKTIASDRDLDSKYGDPVLKFTPRDWTGASFKNRAFSECPPDLLDLVADTFEYFAQQADKEGKTTDKGKPVSEFKRADAARARGWAKRMRDGRHIQTHEPALAGGSNEWEGEPRDWR